MNFNKSPLLAICLVFTFSSFSWCEAFNGRLVSVEIVGSESSSNESEEFRSEKAIDNDFYSRWSSEHTEEPQWLLLDMGRDYTINAVAIAWEAATARIYKIQTSLDGSNWKDVYQVNDGDFGIEVISFPATKARYVRIYCVERTTEYGYSIHEIRLYKKGKVI